MSTPTRLPPFAALAVASISAMLIGGIDLAARVPGHPPLTVPAVLVAAGGVLTVVDLALLARVRSFAWGTFFLVLRWALVAYAVIAGPAPTAAAPAAASVPRSRPFPEE